LSRLPAGADPLDAATEARQFGRAFFSYRIKASFFAPTNGAANNRICGIEFTHQLLRAVALSTLISGRQGAQHDLKLGAAPVDLGEAHAQYLMLFVHHAVKKGATAQKGKGGALA
jgi:predicted ABC-type sugar transport system permease subunit